MDTSCTEMWKKIRMAMVSDVAYIFCSKRDWDWLFSVRRMHGRPWLRVNQRALKTTRLNAILHCLSVECMAVKLIPHAGADPLSAVGCCVVMKSGGADAQLTLRMLHSDVEVTVDVCCASQAMAILAPVAVICRRALLVS